MTHKIICDIVESTMKSYYNEFRIKINIKQMPGQVTLNLDFLSAKWGYMGRINDCKHVTGRPELSWWLSTSVPFACMYLVTPSKGQIHECSTEVSQVPSTEQSDWWPEGHEILWRVCPLASTVLGPSYQSVPWVFRKGRLMSTSIWNNWLFLWAWRLMMSWCWHQDLQLHPA